MPQHRLETVYDIKFAKIKVKISKAQARGVKHDYFWIGKSEEWVVQKMHRNSFNVQI